jgi:RNA polymerase sigma-70 factor (ECF subfamily)
VSDEREAPAPDDDWDALARVAAGDADAFTPLVARHQDRLIALCQRFLGDRDEALDVAQEVFLKLYRHAGRTRPQGKLFTWLYRVGVNHCLNRLRRRKLVRFLSFGGAEEGEGQPAFEPAAGGPDAFAELAARERWRATRRALDALPENQRAVVILAKFEGLSQKQIAETLAITEGAVESRLVRAMRRLTAAQEPAPPGVATRRAGR